MDRVERHLDVALRLGYVLQECIIFQPYGITKQEVVEPAAMNCPKLFGRFWSPCHALEHSRCSAVARLSWDLAGKSSRKSVLACSDISVCKKRWEKW